jgi:hypothetical protein
VLTTPFGDVPLSVADHSLGLIHHLLGIVVLLAGVLVKLRPPRWPRFRR